MKFSQILEINDQKLTKKYIQSLSFEEREKLIEPIFELLRKGEFIYPDDFSELRRSYQRLEEYSPDLSKNEIFNNSSLGTDICKFFCKTFYLTTQINRPNMIEIFNNDDKLRSVIRNRLGMDWLLDDEKGKGVNESFNLSFRMIVQGMRSMQMVNQTSIFKPIVAKYLCEKYSQPGDLVGDYSCGFGGRMLGAMNCGRKYMGTDPLTVPDLRKMIEYFDFKDCELIESGSENYCGGENTVDLYYSSPPYFSQECYSSDSTQAYAHGEDYFYNIYWAQTLKNVRYMLKPGKWFGLNVKNYPKMLEMAQEVFGPIKEEVALRTVRSHLTKSAGITKNEYIYMFVNEK